MMKVLLKVSEFQQKPGDPGGRMHGAMKKASSTVRPDTAHFRTSVRPTKDDSAA